MSISTKEQLDLVYQCFKQMDDIFHAYAVEQHLSDSAFWVLYALCERKKPYTQNELCQEWYYTKQTVHSAVASLTKAGYVQLEHIPGSRNKKSIALTQAGCAYVDAHIRPLMDAEQRAFEQLSDRERDSYLQLVKKHIQLFRQAVETHKEEMQSSEDLSSQ